MHCFVSSMEKNVTNVKLKFFTFLLFYLLILGGELFYLSSRPTNLEALKKFAQVTEFFTIAFYSNTPLLRHRDLNNIDAIFPYHPALRESKMGTFINASPVKK